MIQRFFHRTNEAAADAILAGGFRDYDWHDMAGVWLSINPVDVNMGAKGDVLLEVMLDLPPETINDYEVIESCKPEREWIFPAELVNAHGTVRRLTDEEETAILWEHGDPAAVADENAHGLVADSGRGYWIRRAGPGPVHPPFYVPGKWYFDPMDWSEDPDDPTDLSELPYCQPHDTADQAEAAAREFDQTHPVATD